MSLIYNACIIIVIIIIIIINLVFTKCIKGTNLLWWNFYIKKILY
ncbi:MAG: hypothetical protein N7Q72_02455 [Spiroplasma sp. Tabriz.8]|nr:hypothetical protein [Spiroplasma sp. Tabriz.8]